jgi:uncharacterized protein YjbI with pentapeptide repeats
MANEEHIGTLRRGVTVWNDWRRSNPDIRPDLSEADLSWADLTRANLVRADLNRAVMFNAIISGATLSGAALSNAFLNGANLSGADLSGAMLRDANLLDADLSEAALSKAVLNGANLRKANLSGADLSGAYLQHATLVQTNVADAKLDSCHVYGISVWDLKGTPESQRDLLITPEDAPAITVDDLEVAQFIYLLLKHEKLRKVINAVTQRGVLILGRFSDGGIDVLRAIAQKPREEGYLPIIFDFDSPDDRDYTETVKTLVGLSRFVIVALSGPSVPQELYATVPHFDIPFVPIVETGRKPYSMVVDLSKYPWFLNPPVEFGSKEKLIELMPSKVISPAEERHKERQSLLDQVFKT